MNMNKKLNKLVLTGLAISMLSITQVYARDSFSVGINVGAYDYVAPMVTHYPNTIYYSRTPTVIYYGAPAVVQYAPIVHYESRGGYGRQGGERCREPERNFYREWNHGWRNSYHDERGQRHGRWERD